MAANWDGSPVAALAKVAHVTCRNGMKMNPDWTISSLEATCNNLEWELDPDVDYSCVPGGCDKPGTHFDLSFGKILFAFLCKKFKFNPNFTAFLQPIFAHRHPTALRVTCSPSPPWCTPASTLQESALGSDYPMTRWVSWIRGNGKYLVTEIEDFCKDFLQRWIISVRHIPELLR